MPTQTQLPLHVNGFFELSTNRRDLWHGEDLGGSGKQRALWNLALLADGVAPAYARLLVAAAQRLGPAQPYWNLWPGQSVQKPWSTCVADRVFKLVRRRPRQLAVRGDSTGMQAASRVC